MEVIFFTPASGSLPDGSQDRQEWRVGGITGNEALLGNFSRENEKLKRMRICINIAMLQISESDMAQPYVRRHLERVLKEAAGQFPALILTGPRQSGKTTLLKHIFSKTHRYVTLDDPESRLLANDDPKLFLTNYPAPVLIDEIQYAPKLFPYLKIHIDENRSEKGQFLLTGSQMFPLMAGVSESLAGRIGVFSLLSFSLKEEAGNKRALNLNWFKERALRGGYPEVALSRKGDWRLWQASYLQTYLERDVRALRQIGDLTEFQRFLQMLAAYNGQVLNLSNFSRDLGVAVNTVKNWISILEAGHQIVLIRPYYRNRGKRLVKSPKVYFLDTGFLCYLCGFTTQEQIFRGPLSVPLLETIVLGEIIRDFYHRGEVPKIFWWRTSYGEEVDFIVESQGKLIPIEVKLSAKQNKDITQGIASFNRLFSEDVRKGYLVNLSDRKMILDEKIEIFPYLALAAEYMF